MEAENALALHHLAALDLFNELWDQMQKPDGTPKDITANELLMMLFEEMRNQAVVQSQHEQRVNELTAVMNDQSMQIIDLVRQLSYAHASGERKARADLLINLKYDFDIEHAAAEALLTIIETGSISEDTPRYILTDLKDAFQQFEYSLNRLDELEVRADEGDDDGDDLS